VSDLTEFLLARIAEDEAVAREQAATTQTGIALEWERDVDYGERYLTIDPARILAECEAKRRIVDLHATAAVWQLECPTCAVGAFEDHGTAEVDREPHPCGTLRALALPYADHPDYRPEWKP